MLDSYDGHNENRDWNGQLSESLVHTFGVPFQLRRAGPPWTLLVESPQAGGDLDPEIKRALAQAVDGSEPVFVPTQPGLCQLVLPIPGDDGLAAVAVATLPCQDPQLLIRLARQVCQRMALEQRIVQYEREVDEFSVQITQDFEELTFLRNIAHYLELTGEAADFETMVDAVLPLLIRAADAQCLVMCLADGDSATADKTSKLGRSFRRVGSAWPSDAICRQLVQRFRDESRRHPVVKNHFERSTESIESPGVQQFVLVPITKADWTAGWLLALNRANGRPRQVENPLLLGQDEFGTAEASLLASAASILAAHASNVQLFRAKEKLLVSVVRSLVSAIDAKDPYTCGHSERVALFAKRLAQQVGLSAAECERIYLSGLLHDVGKIGISDQTLGKPGRLTDEEFAEIQTHPDKGWAILHELEPLRHILPGVLYHHERFDGRGYPDGLAGEDIPLAGRILAVADAYDAMTSNRPYRQGMPQEKALSILRDGAGVQWDPAMLDAFFKAMPDILAIRQRYQPPNTPRRQRGSADIAAPFANAPETESALPAQPESACA